MNEPRVYKQPLFGIFLSGVMLMFSCGILFFVSEALTDLWFMIPILGLFGIAFLISLFSYTSKVTITDDEITSSYMFIPKTLRWTEINRASGTGSGIKLHSEDVTVSINSRLPGVEEIIETIGQKRADLFSTTEFSEFRRGLGSYFGFFIIFLLFAGIGVFYFSIADFSSESLISMGFIALFLIFFMWTFLASPQSITLENNNLQIKYLLGEKNFLANEIGGFYFSHTRTRRGGKQYYISLNLRDGKNIRISGLNIGLPVAYLVLKNWHKKFAN
ncbi:MAG TPA: hypothetical protein DHW49_06840 [Anaerolineae bacterium]|nr:hypothetical protein [Anaerolineae bacterium]